MSECLVVRGGCSSLEPASARGTVVPGLAAYVRHTRRVQFPAALGAAVREIVGAAPGARSPPMQLGDALFDEARRAMALGRHDWDDLMTYFAYAPLFFGSSALPLPLPLPRLCSEVSGFGAVRLKLLYFAATGRALPPPVLAGLLVYSRVVEPGLRAAEATFAARTTGHSLVSRADALRVLADDDPEAGDEALDAALETLGARVRAMPGDDLMDACAFRGEAFVLRRLEAPPPDGLVEGGFEDPWAGSPVAPNEGQRAAVRGLLAAAAGVMCLVGAAGTGKTRTIAAVLAACRSARRAVVVLAPTGAAAHRVRQALGAEQVAALAAPVSTVHHFVAAARGLRKRRRAAPDRAAPIDLVVVDEASMLDSATLGRLVDAVTARRSLPRLLLVGDDAQLPPVGVGSVFRDLVSDPAARAPLFRLTELMRCRAGGVAEMAAFVRDVDRLGVYVPDPHDLFVDYRPDLHAHLDGAVDRLFRDDTAWFRRTAILAYRNAVVDHINAACVARLAPGLEPSGALGRWAFPGAKVVFTRNDPALETVNGLVGYVDHLTAAAVHVRLEDEGGVLRRVPRAYECVRPAYALTVHKAQGSEYDRVLFVCTGGESVELVYTAITRARAELSVLCPGNVMLAHREPRRRTWLASELEGTD